MADDGTSSGACRKRGLARALASGVLVAAMPLCAAQSVCHGTPADGRLEAGVRLPLRGDNFVPYSELGVRLGRTHVHDRVARAVTAAYAALAASRPDTVYVYGETGFAQGGRFEPHRTHRNGLSVDFMVPVADARGRSVPLPASADNRFGYDIEFDDEARAGELRIDFDAVAAHLLALHAAAEGEGIRIGRVIFEPAYLPRLFAAEQGALVRRRIAFMQRPAWVRHDEHYHVDFELPCRPLRD
ncbi:penicillin-insensitive murein endopeptidase [Luteimonas sp. Y-2-2-4F]|nr:penicillin-insensitive murein endopeptidase [Luteimonas sp. Y-2-2-4F]MCD9032334.1 penicillin-insensitive murein endopeptidase [Luteimonas sp. Y-2-2-4F]